ncbi:MAG: hypothetical protein ACW98I_08415 [Candidatus Hodarchaeales archaeon]
MPFDTKPKNKRKTEKNPYTIHFSAEERNRLKDFANVHGYSTESGIIKDSLKAVYQNPTLLEPTESVSFQENIEKLQEAVKTSIDHKSAYNAEIDIRLEKLERLVEGIALKVGMTKKEVSNAKKKDRSGEVVFE